VAIDHVAYLGSDRESIGWEKAHVFRAGRPAICADPMPPDSVAAMAAEIGADLWQFGRDFNYAGDRQQWAYAGRAQRRNSLAYPALRGANQLLNAAAALAALEALRDRLPVAQKDVRQGFAQVSLRGRFEILPGQPVIVLDAAHNPHAAAHLAANLDNMGFFPYTYAVFGMMADKDIDGVLAAMGERVDHWYVTDLPLARAASATDLSDRLASRGIPSGDDQSVTCCASPSAGLAQARERAGENDRILVFGSFHVLADILPSPVA
jgi:dihydrofolate synthase/folylpolyglutamate synthase